MSEIGDLAQIAKIVVDGSPIAVKGTLKALKLLAQLLTNGANWLQYHKQYGDVSVKNLMIKANGDVGMRQVPTEQLEELIKQAKDMGVMVAVLPDLNSKDGYSQVMINNMNADVFDSVINVNLVEKFKPHYEEKLKTENNLLSKAEKKLEEQNMLLEGLNAQINDCVLKGDETALSTLSQKKEELLLAISVSKNEIANLQKDIANHERDSVKPITPISLDDYARTNTNAMRDIDRVGEKIANGCELYESLDITEALSRNASNIPEGNVDYIYAPGNTDFYIERTYHEPPEGVVSASCSHTLKCKSGDEEFTLDDKEMFDSTYSAKLDQFLEEAGIDKRDLVVVIGNKEEFKKQFEIDKNFNSTPSRNPIPDESVLKSLGLSNEELAKNQKEIAEKIKEEKNLKADFTATFTKEDIVNINEESNLYTFKVQDNDMLCYATFSGEQIDIDNANSLAKVSYNEKDMIAFSKDYTSFGQHIDGKALNEKLKDSSINIGDSIKLGKDKAI